jgi:hypothetical protein
MVLIFEWEQISFKLFHLNSKIRRRGCSIPSFVTDYIVSIFAVRTLNDFITISSHPLCVQRIINLSTERNLHDRRLRMKTVLLDLMSTLLIGGRSLT